MNHLAMVSDPSFETRVYQLSDDTQIFSYTANTAIMKWVLFGDDEFFTVSADNTIKRFIDDGFGIWTHGREKLKEFQTCHLTYGDLRKHYYTWMI